MKDRGRIPLFALVTGVFAVVLYISTFNGPFLEFDDQYFIQTDKAIRHLGGKELLTIFTEPYFANFHPVTRLSYAVDYALWGFDPRGFHATSLLLYGLGCGLFFLFLNRMLRHPWAALMGALLFAAHTTHVEVTAWLSARKDLLCLIFGMSALILFMKHREREGFSFPLYGGLLACCILAGLSKSLAVILPVLFFFMDLIWFKRRKAKTYLDLIPVFLLMVGIGALNVDAQSSAGAIKSEPLPLFAMGKVTFDYLWKTVLPLKLSARYVLNPDTIKGLESAAGLLLFLALSVTAFILFLRKQRLFPLVFVFWLIPLLPVSNIIPLSTPMADRYLFWPTLAWCLLLGGWLKLRPKQAGYVLCVILLAVYSCLTWSRCKVWLDEELLWKDALKENPKNHHALATLGGKALEDKRYNEARDYLNRVDASGGGMNVDFLLNRGILLKWEGKAEEALKSYRAAFDLGGWLVHRAAGNIGLTLSELGRYDEAESWLKKAMDLYVKTQESRVNVRISLARVYFETQRFELAEQTYREACEEAPDDPRPRFYLGLAREKRGKYEEAVADFQAALKLRGLPSNVSFDYGDIHLMLGKVYLERLNRPDLAKEHFKKTLEMNPNHPQREALEHVIRSN